MINDITDGPVNLDVKIIYDKNQEQNKFGKRIKTVIVVDAEATDSSYTALLDLYNEDIDKFKFRDKIRIINGYAKIITTKKGDQPSINYGLNGKYVKL